MGQTFILFHLRTEWDLISSAVHGCSLNPSRIQLIGSFVAWVGTKTLVLSGEIHSMVIPMWVELWMTRFSRSYWLARGCHRSRLFLSNRFMYFHFNPMLLSLTTWPERTFVATFSMKTLFMVQMRHWSYLFSHPEETISITYWHPQIMQMNDDLRWSSLRHTSWSAIFHASLHIKWPVASPQIRSAGNQSATNHTAALARLGRSEIVEMHQPDWSVYLEFAQFYRHNQACHEELSALTIVWRWKDVASVQAGFPPLKTHTWDPVHA